MAGPSFCPHSEHPPLSGLQKKLSLRLWEGGREAIERASFRFWLSRRSSAVFFSACRLSRPDSQYVNMIRFCDLACPDAPGHPTQAKAAINSQHTRLVKTSRHLASHNLGHCLA